MEAKGTILTSSYDFLKLIIKEIKNFPRAQKYLLGDRIQNLVADILDIFIEAYYTSGSQKKSKLQKANILLEKLRIYIRLCYELGFYNSYKYKSLIEKIQEIGRMNGGWIKSLS